MYSQHVMWQSTEHLHWGEHTNAPTWKEITQLFMLALSWTLKTDTSVNKLWSQNTPLMMALVFVTGSTITRDNSEMTSDSTHILVQQGKTHSKTHAHDALMWTAVEQLSPNMWTAAHDAHWSTTHQPILGGTVG